MHACNGCGEALRSLLHTDRSVEFLSHTRGLPPFAVRLALCKQMLLPDNDYALPCNARQVDPQLGRASICINASQFRQSAHVRARCVTAC